MLVLSEFQPPSGTWIPFRPTWTLQQNLALCRSEIAGRKLAYTALMLEPQVPAWGMRLIAVALRPLYCLFFNENLDHFLLRPRCAPVIARHLLWRAGNWIRFQAKPQARWKKWLRRLTCPAVRRALLLGLRRYWSRPAVVAESVPVPWPEPLPEGISVLGPPRAVDTRLRLEFVESLERARFRWLAMGSGEPGELDRLAEHLAQDETLFSVQAAPATARFLPRQTGAYVFGANAERALFCTRKVQALKDDADPMTLGFRAWLAGWPSLQIDAVRSASVSAQEPTREFLDRRGLPQNGKIVLSAIREKEEALENLRGRTPRLLPEDQRRTARQVLALTGGEVAVFEGKPPSGKPRILVAAPYPPFPLSHGGAVRMFNLMRRAAANFDQVLVVFVDRLHSPPPELLDIFCQVVQVERTGSHRRPLTERPDTVEEFDVPAFHAALRATVARWRPAIVQLEYTRMAMYAPDCEPARTILVEHDVKVDLYAKLLRERESWEWRQQYERWKRFEAQAWQSMDAVVVMSATDRATIGPRGVALANGVDIERFTPALPEPEPARLLFIGSFGHLPNLLALEFFLTRVKPLLAHLNPVVHIIAGKDPQAQLRHHANRVSLDLNQPGIELEGFVADVRPAYRRATLVLAPLTASAGTNIKVLEAMAMGRAVVSTQAGVNGLDLADGDGVAITGDPAAMAHRIETLLADPDRRRALEVRGRQIAVERFDWDVIARRQAALYNTLL